MNTNVQNLCTKTLSHVISSIEFRNGSHCDVIGQFLSRTTATELTPMLLFKCIEQFLPEVSLHSNISQWHLVL